MDCNKLASDIEQLKTLRKQLSDELEKANESGKKEALPVLSQKASNAAEALLEEYAYDLVEQNINDPSGRNSKFLDSILEQYWQEEQSQNQSQLNNSETENTKANSEFLITKDTTIDQVRNNLSEYLKADRGLDSNLLTYALKEKLGLPKSNTESGNQLEELYKDIMPESIKDKTFPKLAYLYKIAERVKNLEVLRKDHGIYLLPKDIWNEGKRNIPNPNNNPYIPAHIASQDLEVIILKPYGQYTEEWVGKLGKYHTHKDLVNDKVNKWVQQFGFHIPTKDEWVATVNSLRAKLAKEQNTTPDQITGEQLSTALRERLGLAFAGWVYDGELEVAGKFGFFWSASGGSADNAYCLLFGEGYVSPEYYDYRYSANSVRCVSESGSFPNS